VRDINFFFEQDNLCEKDLQIVCEGDCASCPNREYFRLWDMVKSEVGTRPNFIVIEVKEEKNV